MSADCAGCDAPAVDTVVQATQTAKHSFEHRDVEVLGVQSDLALIRWTWNSGLVSAGG